MENKINLTIIIPVHKLDEKDKTLLNKAIESVKKQKIQPEKILIVCSPDPELENLSLEYLNVSTIINYGETDFCSQINFGVSKIETKYFSILELDDEYADSYLKNVSEYIKTYPSVSGFLPVTVLVNSNNEALAFANEAVWAQGFGEKIGFMDMTSLLQYDNFMISGGIFDKEAFEEVGGLKNNIKLYFNYEFLLRFVNNDFTTMVIPKLGYKHLTDRNNSLFMSYADPINGIKQDEALFFKSAAKKEYFFNPNIIKRDIKYSYATI